MSRRLTREGAVRLLYYGAAALAMLLFGALLAVLGYYPLTSTRHSAILLVFTLPVACLLLSEFCGGRSGRSFLCAILVMLGLLLYRGSLRPLSHPDGRRAGMMKTAEVLRSAAGEGQVVFSDYGSALVMQYYLDRRRITIDFIDEPAGYFHDYWWAGVHVVCSSIVDWPTPESFFQQLDSLRKQRDLGRGVYVVNAGWAKPLGEAVDAPGRKRVQWLVRVPENPELFNMALENTYAAAR